MSVLTREDAETLLFREALLLDRRDWDAWLEMYAEDAVYWIPAWRDETEPTQNPDAELSLIYYQSRKELEERVWRARSGLSVASTPLPRAVHVIGNVLVDKADAEQAELTASFVVHYHDVRAERTHAFFGRYEYRIRTNCAQPKIAFKKILLLNDNIPAVLDFYLV